MLYAERNLGLEVFLHDEPFHRCLIPSHACSDNPFDDGHSALDPKRLGPESKCSRRVRGISISTGQTVRL